MGSLSIRPARIEARFVQWGDVLVTARGGMIIGTVIAPLAEVDGRIRWRYRSVAGVVRETKPVALGAVVWVHLPSGQV